MVTVIAILKAKQGKEAELAEACRELAKEVRQKEEGCLMYIPHISAEDTGKIVFFEKYKDPEAQKAHRQSEHFRAAGAKFKELLDGGPELQVLSELS
ncbi:MAG: putative quinol monooxygenase [Desulfitobacteriaceae bacterium]